MSDKLKAADAMAKAVREMLEDPWDNSGKLRYEATEAALKAYEAAPETKTSVGDEQYVHTWPHEFQLAQWFHETYERLAPSFGYETRKDSAKPWEEVPEKNKNLMTAVCREILIDLSRAKPVADSAFDPVKGQATADMINAFLQWKLPQSVASDPCVLKQQKDRTGTNLLSLTETMQMIQEVVCPIIAKHLNQ